MMNRIKLLVVLFSVIAVVGCKDKETYSKIESTKENVKSDIHKIVINESLNGGGYTYINVNEEGNIYWMAIPNTQVKIGETYYYSGGMVMKDFESKTLDKKFDFITFAEGIRITEHVVPKTGEHKHVIKTDVTVEITKIDQPSNGTSLAKLFADKEGYAKKNLVVKGKVVKVNNGIMKRNWVHISDGTQFEDLNRLTITTTEEVKVGDVVTFEGIVILNKDFGAGYVYDILLEEGKLVK